MLSENYASKDTIYFTKPRYDLISLMRNNPCQKVLEIGMGGGDTLVEIKKRGLANEVVGVDLMQLNGTNQTSTLIDKVIFMNLDNQVLELPDNYFDVLIAGDVLEHLTDPWGVLHRVSAKVKNGGQILISLPNIREVKALLSIFMKGRFAYKDQGIFDKTHLRFFCKKDMIDLIKSIPGLQIELISPIHVIMYNNSKREIFNRLTLKIFEEFTTGQYLFSIKKN